jgi:hypothetical protein
MSVECGHVVRLGTPCASSDRSVEAPVGVQEPVGAHDRGRRACGGERRGTARTSSTSTATAPVTATNVVAPARAPRPRAPDEGSAERRSCRPRS